jgi:hypothetical protein
MDPWAKPRRRSGTDWFGWLLLEGAWPLNVYGAADPIEPGRAAGASRA